MYFIGVDLGTSAVKLLLMEESGKICNIVSKEYPLFFPHPGWSEQNPEDWFAQSMEGIKELTEGIDRKEVAGIGFGGQMHGLVTLDKDDNVIRPAILWNDGRTGEETEYLNTVIGKEKLSQYTANIAFAGFTAPKILWMQKHEPENFKKVVKIMLPKDYIGTHLYVGLISLAAVVGLLIIGTCSANMKVHLTLLLLGAVVQPVGFFTIGTLMGRGYIVCRDTAVLKQYVIYLYGGAFILAIILWMGSKLNRYILNKLWISMLASLIMAGVIAQMLNQKYDHLMATGELIVGFLCAVIYLVAVSGTWTLANADWGKYNRYHAVYTSNKMINVFATIFNAAGYYSGKNWRR